MKRSTIFIRSYYKDFPWLHYCLRSIRKFCTGFDVLVVAQDERIELLQNIDAPIYTYNAPYGTGMTSAMNVALNADMICPNAEYIFFVDCDCIFTKPVTPETYIRNGRILYPCQSFEALRNSADEGERRRADIWQDATEAALGWRPLVSTMCRIPVVHHRLVFPRTREAIKEHTGKSPRDYIVSLPNEFPWKFSEFEALGSIAVRQNPYYLYSFHAAEILDPRLPNGAGGPYSARFTNVNCYWSHGSITPQIRAEIEGILQ